MTAGPQTFGYFTAALLVTAALALAAGIQFLVIGLRDRRDRTQWSFALLCLCVGTLAVANIVMHGADTLQTARLGLRLAAGSALLAVPLLMLFVASYTGRPVPRPANIGAWLLAITLFAFNLEAPGTAFDDVLVAGAPIVLPWGETLFTLAGQPSIGGWIFHTFAYTVFLWALYRATRQYLTADPWRGGMLLLCLLVQTAALLWGFVAVNTFDQPYPSLDAFAFLSFVLLMSLSLAREMHQRSLALRQAAQALVEEAAVRRDIEHELRHAASHEALTGLPNRLHLVRTLGEWQLAARRDGRFGAVLMIDLDNFRTINDSLGHAVGDSVLRALAAALPGTVPDEAFVAHLGGDEFAVLLPATGEETASAVRIGQRVAERLLTHAEAPLVIEHLVFSIGMSIGIAAYPGPDTSADVVLRQADIGLNHAKAAGRRTVRLFQPQMQREADRRLELERGLRLALQRHELELHFQPQVALDGRLAGAEALLRWRHPTLGMVGPATFIPIAEETGLIHAIGHWVIGAACASLRGWHAAGVDFGGHLSVNVSPWQLAHPEFVASLAAQVREAGILPGTLTLEITESALLNDFSAARGTLHQLAHHGFRLALDDFGTGYSSLSYLQQLPLDELKVDRAFVSALHPAAVQPLAGFIIDVARRLGMQTVAEGVETPAQLAALEQLGCHLIQGDYISPPLAGDDYLSWLERRMAAKAPRRRLDSAS